MRDNSHTSRTEIHPLIARRCGNFSIRPKFRADARLWGIVEIQKEALVQQPVHPLATNPLAPPMPAAQYVRMSTEHQQYSTENQRDLIRDYAAVNSYDIVRTFADDGRSGLRLEGRDALKQMIAEVESGKADFKAILVYDVSRWGRFQDADEAAHYEFICKRAGITVIYCAEQFANDGSTGSALIKSLKRHMAGEYSRELSAKVFKGQCRLIQLGYRQGGQAGFGLRRMLVDHTGESKGLLKQGEHKSLQTDRVVLVPGPEAEVEAVRSIYRMFVIEGKKEGEIAHLLGRAGTTSESGRPWTRSMVHQILTNEKYIGNNVYNRRSFKLKKDRVVNPPELWVRHNHAFDAIVDVESFFTVKGIIQERHRIFTDADMIDWLKRLHVANGRLSAHLIDTTDGAPSSSVYRNRFGSLIEAYKAAGFDPGRAYDFLHVNRHLRSLYPDILSQTVQQLEGVGATVLKDNGNDQLLINGAYSAALVLTRCRQTPRGSLRWQITLDQRTVPDITIVVRMDATNEQPADYYLLPMIDIPASKLRFHEDNGAFLDTYRFASLSYFVQMSAQVRIEVAA